MSKTKGGCGLWMLVLIGAPIVLLLGLLGFFVIGEQAARSKVKDRIAEFRAEGMPVDDESLDVYYRQNSSTELTDRWLGVLNRFRDEGVFSDEQAPWLSGVANIDPASGRWVLDLELKRYTNHSDEELDVDLIDQKVDEYFKRMDPILDDAKSILAEKQRIYLPIEFDGFNTLLVDIQDSRALARLFALRARIAMREGDSQGVVDSIEMLDGLAISMESTPSLVAGLVCISIDGIKIDLLKDALENNALDAEGLKQLLPSILSQANINDMVKRSFISERAFGLIVFQTGSFGAEEGKKSLHPFHGTDSLSYLEAIDQVFDVLPKDDEPIRDLGRFRKEMDAASARVNDEFEQRSMLQRIQRPLSGLVMPSFDAVTNAAAGNAQQHRMAAIAIAIRIHEKENATLPSNLK
ncbi:MAG: hypothetical protein AAFP90_08555, partial [Planctomycetota bacterium]